MTQEDKELLIQEIKSKLKHYRTKLLMAKVSSQMNTSVAFYSGVVKGLNICLSLIGNKK